MIIKSMRNKFWIWGILLGIVTGCARYEPSYLPVTTEEAGFIADSITAAIEMYDASFFFEHEDPERTAERLWQWNGSDSLLDNPEEAQLYLAQLPFATFVLEGDPEMDTEWVYAYPNRLRMLPDSNYIVQIRVHDIDFEVNYFEFLVEHRKADPVDRFIITDLYSYNIGMWVSELVFHQSLSNQYFESFVSLEDSLTQLDSLYIMVQEGRFRAADSLFHLIPPEGQDLLIPNRLHLDIAGNVSEHHYEAALSQFEEKFPGDSDLLRRKIQWAYYSATFDTFHTLIDTLEARLGGADAYTHWSHGDAYHLEGKMDTARNYFEQAIELEPEFLLPLISLFYNQLDRRQYADAVSSLSTLEEEFGVKIGMLEVEKYPGFLNSREMEAWVLESDPMPGEEE